MIPPTPGFPPKESRLINICPYSFTLLKFKIKIKDLFFFKGISPGVKEKETTASIVWNVQISQQSPKSWRLNPILQKVEDNRIPQMLRHWQLGYLWTWTKVGLKIEWLVANLFRKKLDPRSLSPHNVAGWLPRPISIEGEGIYSVETGKQSHRTGTLDTVEGKA